MSESPRQHPFVTYLESLPGRQDGRAILAELRRGLGQPGSETPSMYQHLYSVIPEGIDDLWERQCYFLIAALYASHSKSVRQGNLGDHFAKTLDPGGEGANGATERRFTALLNAHPDDLPFYLRQAVSFLRSHEEIPINWHRLFYDVRVWDDADGRSLVQRRWARQFWRRQSQTAATSGEETTAPATAADQAVQ